MAQINVTLVVGGTDISAYVIATDRRASLCGPGQTLVAQVSSGVTLPNESDSVVFSEEGVKVLTGFVIGIDRSRPEGIYTIHMEDTYHRVNRTFIHDEIITDEAKDTAYWAGVVLDRTGISYSINGDSRPVPVGVTLGLRPAVQALADIMAYSSWYAFPDANGVLQVGPIAAGTVDHTLSSFIDFTRATDDSQTRNEIKVFGSDGLGPLGEGSVFTTAYRDIGLIPQRRTAAVGSGLIETQAEAQRVANYLLDELGRPTDKITGTVPLNPNVSIGQKVRMVYDDSAGFKYNGVDTVTTIESRVEESGATTSITMGERCPRIAGWSTRYPPVYAGTSGSGVWVSNDAGVTWTEFNDGLSTETESRLYVRSLCANYYGELMAVINAALYYHDGTEWSATTLPNPTNDAGDDPAPTGVEPIVVDSGMGQGEFFVLAQHLNNSDETVQQARAWVYETKNSGSSWDSVQLISSGSNFHVVAHDLSSKLGIPYAVVSSGSLFHFPNLACSHDAIVRRSSDWYRTRPVSFPEQCHPEDPQAGDIVCEGIGGVGATEPGVTGVYPRNGLQFTWEAKSTQRVRFSVWVEFTVISSSSASVTATIELWGKDSGGMIPGEGDLHLYQQESWTYPADIDGPVRHVEKMTFDDPSGGTDPLDEVDFGPGLAVAIGFIYRQAPDFTSESILVATGMGLSGGGCGREEDGGDCWALQGRTNGMNPNMMMIRYSFCDNP